MKPYPVSQVMNCYLKYEFSTRKERQEIIKL